MATAREIAITMDTESRGRRYGGDGQLLTSPKGARGEMQVMPGTERDPGFGVRPARDGSPDEIARVGRDYLAAMKTRYGGDMRKAWAAYNAGPGTVDSAVKRHGARWLSAMPAETRQYVGRNISQLEGGGRQSAGGGSTYDRVTARQRAQEGPSMQAVYDAYKKTGKAGGMTPQEAAQFEKAVLDGHIMLPRGAQIRRKPSAPVLPKSVVDAYNSRRMDDDPAARAEIERAVNAGEVAVPRGMTLQAPAPRTAGELIGMGARDIMEGGGKLVDIVAGPLNAVVNALPGHQGLSTSPFHDLGRDAADAMGLARAESDTEQLYSGIIEGATQGLASAGIGGVAAGVAGAIGTVGRAVAANPALDTVIGAVSGGSQEAARQAGAGPVGQLAAGLAGGLTPVGLAGVAERAAARIRAPRTPRTLPETVAETPRAAVIDEAGNLTPEGREIAARHGATPDEVRAAYDAPPEVRRGTANDQQPPAVAREATTDAPVAPRAEAEAPAPPRQPEAPAPRPAPEPAPAAAMPEGLPPTALQRVEQAGEFGIDMTRGQATRSFDIQDAEQRLRNMDGAEGDEMRAFVARQTEQVREATERFREAFGDTTLSAEERGQMLQEALRDLRDQGRAGVNALYTAARETAERLGDNSRNALNLDAEELLSRMREIWSDESVPDNVRNGLRQLAAEHGLIGERPVTIEGETAVQLRQPGTDNTRTITFTGAPKTLDVTTAERFRQRINDMWEAGKRNRQEDLKPLIDDAVERAVERTVTEDIGGDVGQQFQRARQAHRDQKQTFAAKDVVQEIVDWKAGTRTGKLSPEQAVQRALRSTSDLKRVKAVLLSKPTEASRAAWRGIQAHGLATIFQKATTHTTNPAGEIVDAISGAKLRSEIGKFGTDKLKVLLDPDDFSRMMKLRRTIEDVTVPIAGTVNHSNSANLIMRLMKDVDKQVMGAFAAAGFTVGGPAGAMIGGAAGRAISPTIKAAKEAREAAETLRGATKYTAAQAARETGKPARGRVAKAASAAKTISTDAIRAFIDTYSTPRVLAPVLASSAGAQENE